MPRFYQWLIEHSCNACPIDRYISIRISYFVKLFFVFRSLMHLKTYTTRSMQAECAEYNVTTALLFLYVCVCVWCPLNQMPFRLAFLCKLPVQCSEIIVHRVSLSMLCRCCRFLSSLIKDCSTSAQVSYIFTLSFRPFLSESVFHYSVTPRQIQHCGIGASAQRMILFVKIYNMWRSINHRGAGWSWWQMILFELELIIIYYLINHWDLLSLQATSCTVSVADNVQHGSALQPTWGLTGTSVRLELICCSNSRLPRHQYLVYVETIYYKTCLI